MASKQPKPVRAPKVKPDRSENVRNHKRRHGDEHDPAEGISVAGHPRAAAQVRRAKGFGGLAGFALAGVLSANAGVPVELIGERALGAGVAGYLIAWGASVTVWRQLMLAELRAAVEAVEERRKSAAGAAQANAIPERF